MNQLAESVLAAGGEIVGVTVQALGFHAKPCGLLDVQGFYEPLKQMLGKAEQEGFMQQPYRQAIAVSSDPAEMLDLLITAKGLAP